MSGEVGSRGIERRDRYTIVVDGYAIHANEQQERAIRNMTAQQRADFLSAMGRIAATTKDPS